MIAKIPSRNAGPRGTRHSVTTLFILLLALAVLLNISATARPDVPADSTVYGRPKLIVSSSLVAAQPGKEDLFPRVFDLNITISNIGSSTASHILMTLPTSDYVSVESGSPTFSLNWIGAGQTKDLTLHMLLDGADTSGRVQPVFHFEYVQFIDDDESRNFTDDEPVSLTFGPQGWNRPTLLVHSFSTKPEHPAAGESFSLILSIANVSAGDARQVLVRLGGTEGPKPFATVDSGNVGYIERVPAEGTADATFSMLVDGTATAGIYPIQVSIGYENLLGEPLTESEVVYLKVRTLPALQANLITPPPSPLYVGQSFDLPVEVINIGLQTLNISTIELQGEGLTITDGSVYSGPLDSSTSTSLPATAVAEKAGSLEARLTVHYFDEYNREETWTHTFTIPVQEKEKAASAEAAPTQSNEGGSVLENIWNAILAFFGLGGK